MTKINPFYFTTIYLPYCYVVKISVTSVTSVTIYVNQLVIGYTKFLKQCNFSVTCSYMATYNQFR